MLDISSGTHHDPYCDIFANISPVVGRYIASAKSPSKKSCTVVGIRHHVGQKEN